MWPEQVGWIVPLPQYFSRDPYPQILPSLGNHGWETRGLGPSNRLESSGDALVGVGKTRSSDPTENCTNAIPRAGAGLLEGGCLIWVPVSQWLQPHVAEMLQSPSCPPRVSSRDGGAAGPAGEGAPGMDVRALRRPHSEMGVGCLRCCRVYCGPSLLPNGEMGFYSRNLFFF